MVPFNQISTVTQDLGCPAAHLHETAAERPNPGYCTSREVAGSDWPHVRNVSFTIHDHSLLQ